MAIATRLFPWLTVVGGIAPAVLPCGPFNAAPPAGAFASVKCAGTYPAHLQGICTDDKECIVWCFTNVLVKTDRAGKVLQRAAVASHHGDLCYHDGKVYVAVNLGHFNAPQGKAKSWVYTNNAS